MIGIFIFLGVIAFSCGMPLLCNYISIKRSYKKVNENKKNPYTIFYEEVEKLFKENDYLMNNFKLMPYEVSYIPYRVSIKYKDKFHTTCEIHFNRKSKMYSLVYSYTSDVFWEGLSLNELFKDKNIDKYVKNFVYLDDKNLQMMKTFDNLVKSTKDFL